ncbi:hypothetical protein AHAS_Ahas20G0016200 [Arachis hypogaea]
MGEQFLAVATNTPFYDDDGSLVGIICVSSNSRLFVETRVPCLATNNAKSACIDVRTIKQASKVSNKVKSRIQTGENNGDRESGSGGSHQSEHFSFSEVGVANHREDANSSGASTPRGDVMQSPFGIFSHGEERSQGKSLKESADDNEGKSIHKIITSRAEAWIQKKTMAWP